MTMNLVHTPVVSLELYVGLRFMYEFVLREEAPNDITGAVISANLATGFEEGAQQVLEISTGNGFVVISDGPNQAYQIDVPAAEITDAIFGGYVNSQLVYSMVYQRGSIGPLVLFNGQVSIKAAT